VAWSGSEAELDYASGASYLGIKLFSFMVPLLLIIAAIAAGAAAVAGEEERGTLDLLLSTPVSRRRFVLEKLAALTVELVALGAVLWLSLLVGTRVGGMDVGAGNLGTATASAVLLASGFGAVSLFVGTLTGRRGRAIAVAAAGAVAAYLDSLASLSHVLETMQTASPFYHYAASDPLRHGLQPMHVAPLLALIVAAALLSLLAVDRRDFAS